MNRAGLMAFYMEANMCLRCDGLARRKFLSFLGPELPLPVFLPAELRLPASQAPVSPPMRR